VKYLKTTPSIENQKAALNPFFGDPFGSSNYNSASSTRGFALHQYRRAMEATSLSYHFLLMNFIEALHHMGWCDFNTLLGYRIPESHSGMALSTSLLKDNI